jgi:hypothetical protein
MAILEYFNLEYIARIAQMILAPGQGDRIVPGREDLNLLDFSRLCSIFVLCLPVLFDIVNKKPSTPFFGAPAGLGAIYGCFIGDLARNDHILTTFRRLSYFRAQTRQPARVKM